MKLELNPIPCPRPRIAVRGRFPTAYYPKSYQDWKDEAKKLLKKQIETYFEGPVELTVWFYVTRPKTTKLALPKADIDNFEKSFMDALTQAEAWVDDTLVGNLNSRKRWAPKGVAGYIDYTIEPLIL